MDGLSLFGLAAVSLMLVFYALEQRSPWCVLGFAGACVLGSTYGFLQGAWPFGLVEAVWALVAVQRWRRARRAGSALAAISAIDGARLGARRLGPANGSCSNRTAGGGHSEA